MACNRRTGLDRLGRGCSFCLGLGGTVQTVRMTRTVNRLRTAGSRTVATLSEVEHVPASGSFETLQSAGVLLGLAFVLIGWRLAP